MNVKVNYFAVGLFVTVLSTALIAGILWISAGGPQPVYDRYVVYMTESVSGLSKDGAVKYQGVDVGKIVKMELDRENPQRVRLLLNIKRGIPIKEDTVATLSEQGLTGLAHVSLTGGTRSAPLLQAKAGEKYPVIISKPSRLDEFATKLSSLLLALTETGNKLNALLNDSNRARVGQTLVNLETITTTLAGESENLSALLHDFSATTQNLRQASKRLPESVAHFEKSAIAMEEMANTITLTANNLDQVISSSGQQLDQFTSQALADVPLLVDDLRRVTENLHRLSQKLETDPSVLLFGTAPPQPGPGEEGPR